MSQFQKINVKFKKLYLAALLGRTAKKPTVE